MEPWIVAMCRRACRRQVAGWLVALVLLVAIAAAKGRYLWNFFAGPFAMDGAALSTIGDPAKAPRYFVRVSPSQVIDVGLPEYDGHYWAAQVGNHLLLVRAKAKPASAVTGELKALPKYLSDDISTSGPGGPAMRRMLYPMYLDTQGFRKSGYILLSVAAVFLGLIYLFVRPPLRYANNIMQHPVLRRVAKWGDVASISLKVERALKDEVRFSNMGATLTDDYVVTQTYFRFNVLRMQDLVWAYKKVTKKRVNYMPAGTAFDAILNFRDGFVSVRGSEAFVDQVLTWAKRRAPAAVLGYSAERERMFQLQAAADRRAGVER